MFVVSFGVRGPSVIDEYFANPKANADSWDEDGFFKTGDIMYCDRQTRSGTLWTERRWGQKRLLAHKLRVNVLILHHRSSSKCEVSKLHLLNLRLSFLDTLPLSDCAVIGLKPPPNSDAELPRAYVVRREGTSITEDEVKGLIKERLASYKQLTGGVRFLDEIPKSASGKILKRVLRDEAENEASERVANALPVVNAKL